MENTNWLPTSKRYRNGSPKQATGLGLISFMVVKPLGQVEHSWKDPTEHLTASAPQVVTVHSESVEDVRVCERV